MKKQDALKLLGQRVVKLRRERGMTQEQLAEAAGVSRNHIADIELGARNTGVRSFLLLAPALKCSPGELFADFSVGVLGCLR
ncbi:MAG TPA: helix-turn-helix transcriptional regulator [Verrucomicrobiae bacterium]|jgi:transcriptional regulator with XRE-family HTH domain